MNSVNHLMWLAHPTRDPELRYTPSGAAVCQRGLALNRRWTWQAASRSRRTGVQVFRCTGPMPCPRGPRR